MSDKKEMTQLDLQQRLESAEAHGAEGWRVAMGVAEECDALQQQVNALAAENLAMKSAGNSVIYHYTESNKVGMAKAMSCCIPELDAAIMVSPATDAIKRQWMAEGVDQFAQHCFNKRAIRFWDNAGDEAKTFAAQLRQPEEKGHE